MIFKLFFKWFKQISLNDQIVLKMFQVYVKIDFSSFQNTTKGDYRIRFQEKIKEL